MLKSFALVARASVAQANGPYPGASQARRLRGWTATTQAINTLLFANGDTLRERSHDILRKSPWASSALDKWVANAVGTGIKPQFHHPDAAVKRRLQDLWTRWTDESDADGLTDYYGQQALAYRSMIEGGEAFGRKRFRRLDDGMTVPLQIQLLEAEFLPYQKNASEVASGPGNRIICGIEFSAIGKRIAYHMYRVHPGETVLMSSDAWTTAAIPADQIMHLFRPLRIGQFRGEPWLSKVLVALHDLERMEDATLQAKLMASLFAGYISNPTGEEIISTNGDGDQRNGDVAEVGLEPATIWQLAAGQEIKFTDPPTSADYEPYTRDRRRAIAAGLGSTYSQTTGDYSVANFSSIRAETLEFRRQCEQIQNQVFVYQFCRPTLKAWIEQAVLAGEISAADYAVNPWNYGAEWRTPRWSWVDPLKDVKAELAAIDGGLKARSTTINEMGEDEEKVDEAIARDKERERRLGIGPFTQKSSSQTVEIATQ